MGTQAAVKQQHKMEAECYFRSFYGPETPLQGFLTLWTRQDKLSYFFKYAAMAAKKADELAANKDVYFGLGLRKQALPPDRRGEYPDVIAIPGLWLDIDIAGDNHKNTFLPRGPEDVIEFLDTLPWLPSFIFFTGGGYHVYYLFKELWLFESDQERDIARDLSRHFQNYVISAGAQRGWKIDNTSDLARVLRVPGTYNRKNKSVLVESILDMPDRRYSPADFEDLLPNESGKVEERATRIEPASMLAGIDEGSRDVDLFKYACSLRARNIPEAEARVLVMEAAKNCRPAFSIDEALEKVSGAYRKYEAGTSPRDEVTLDSNAFQEDSVPEIHADALYGLAGDIVQRIDPYTEADQKAILLHILCGFGNMAGDSAYAVVGAEVHPARINAVLVGKTSSARKGSAWSPPREIFRLCDPHWIEERVRTGLSSGEGIIFHMRDAEGKDPGVSDKRLLAIEQEFSSMLKVMGREGNSLSGVIRQAYDHGNLSTLTKNSPLKATRAHFSIIGHTTKEELSRYLDATEQGNGFANRFLWMMVTRSKLLPDGEPIPGGDHH